MANKFKPYIATPCVDNVKPRYAGSIAETFWLMGRDGIEYVYPDPAPNFDCPTQRNLFVAEFLETDCDPLIFIDSDMGWTAEMFRRLVCCEHEIACATYRKKSNPTGEKKWVHTNYWEGDPILINGQPTHRPVIHPRSGFIRIKTSGTGFMAIRRAAIEQIVALSPAVKIGEKPGHWVFSIQPRADGYLPTEDVFFCETWTRLGGEIWCDPLGSCDHVGMYNWRGGLGDTMIEIPEAQVA